MVVCVDEYNSHFGTSRILNKFTIGDFHIDHIRPIYSFNYTSTDDEDFKKC